MNITWSDYPKLIDELKTDPIHLGYDKLDSIATAELLNKKGASNELIERDNVSNQQLIQCVVISEYTKLDISFRDAWNMIINNELIDINALKAQIAEIWSSETQTRQNIDSLMLRPASRAEKIFGRDVIICKWDVARSRDIAKEGAING